MDITFSNIIFFLFLAEQLVMIKLGTYPYTFGIPIKRWLIPEDLKTTSLGGFRFIGRIKILKDKDGNLFVRHMHFPLTWGPYILSGWAKKENPTELVVRIPPLTSLFFAQFILQGLLEGPTAIFWSFAPVGLFIFYFYWSLATGLNELSVK